MDYKMRITAIVFIWLLGVTSLKSFGQADTMRMAALSLEEAQQYALEHNYLSENAKLDYQIARKRAAEILTAGLPNISGEASYQNNFELPVTLIPAEFFGGQEGQFIETEFGTQHNAKLSATATQLLADGRYFIGLKANKTLVELSTKIMEMSQRDLEYAVEEAYYGALVAKETEEILSGNLATLEKTLFETRALYESGFVEELDVDRLELSLNNFKVQVENAATQRLLAEALLKYQIGYPLADSIMLTDSLQTYLEEDDAELTYEFNYQDRLEFKILSAQSMMREFDRKQTMAGYLPSLNFYASYEATAQRKEFNIFETDQRWYPAGQIGLILNVPIFDSFNKKFIGDQKRLERDKVLNQLHNFEQSAKLQVQQAKTSYLNARRQLESQQKNLELAEKIYNKATIKYNEGVGSSLEVTDAEAGLTETQANYTSALYNYLTAKMALKLAKGNY